MQKSSEIKDEGWLKMGEKSPESPKKLGKDYQESSNSGCETDDYEDELL